MATRTTPNDLALALAGEFPAQSRAKGRVYFNSGAVRHVVVRGNAAWAKVGGSQDYSAGLRWWRDGPPDAVAVYCSCPAYENFGPCKHLWALVLELDDAGKGPTGGLRGDVEVIECEDEDVEDSPRTLFGWKDIGQSDGAEIREGYSFDPQPDPYQVPERGREHWEVALREFEGSVPRWRNPWKNGLGGSTELRYVLDLERTTLYGKLRIMVQIHRRLKNGGWGRGKEFINDSGDRAGLEQESDSEIHTSLRGADQGYFSDTMGRDGYSLEDDLGAKLLPQMARTGRMYLRQSRDAELTGVVMDEGQTWDFRPYIEDDETAGEVCLRGNFVRAGEVMDVTAPEWVLATGLLLKSGRLAFFSPTQAATQIAFLREKELRAPEAARDSLHQLLMNCPGYQPAADRVERDVPPEFHLHVQAEEGEARPSRLLTCHVSAMYAGRWASVFEYGEYLIGEDGQSVQRDIPAESDGLTTFLDRGGRRILGENGLPDWCGVTLANLSALVSGLLAEGWTVEADGKLWRKAGRSSFSVRSGIDWFDLEGGIDFGDGQVASLPALLEAAKAGAETVQLGDGTIGVLPERWMESWGMLELAGKPQGDALRFAKNQGWLLDALLAERDVQFDKNFTRLKQRIADFKGLKAKREPKSFQGELRAYQRDGLGWFEFLRKLGIQGCLADDMGLGKTIQVLALLEARRLNRRRKSGVDLPSLVVAPRSVVFNWLDEVKRFTPALRVLEYTGTGRRERLAQADDERVDLVVTTYGTLRRDILELREREFDYVILDEAQAIKNPGSQAAKAARLLQARHRLALSGTPIENHLGELWSLFEFLNPGMLGASRAFQRFSRQTDSTQTGSDQTDGDLSRLARALAPFFLRRTKEEVLPDLPEKTEQVLHCEFKGPERAEYNKLREFYRKSLTSREEEVGLPKMKIQVLEALLRLRQAACHPGLIDRSRTAEDSAKLRVLLPMLEEICAEGHKALIFSQFTSLLGIVREHLDRRGVTYEYLDGRTRKRKEKVDRFQTDEDCPLFLISIKAGGSGLNLTKADYVFLLDPWWNPAVEAQAIDRVHRIGRTKPVIAYRLITSDTVEQKVVELQESKRRLADAILGQGNVGLRDMTREDLQLLLS